MPEHQRPFIDTIVNKIHSAPDTAENNIQFLLRVEAYEYGSTLQTKHQIAEALQSIAIPESMREEVELYLLYLKRYERTTPVFDETCITYDNGYFIGGFPLFDARNFR